MPRRPSHPPLAVFMNGRRVGTLARAASGAVDFRYASDWLTWENAIPVSLSLPLREDRHVGAPVMAVFDNLLPDAEPVRRRIAERVGARGIDAYSLLAALGRDCVGALQFLPEDMDPGPVGAIEGRAVSDAEIGDLLRRLGPAPLGLGPDRDFRISVAGAQEKTALLRHEGRWLKPIGATATTHILKPAIGRLSNGIDLSHSVENEFFCLKLMAAFGLPVAHAEMADFGGCAHAGGRALRPGLARRRPPDPPAAGGLLPGAVGPSDAQVPVRRRPGRARPHRAVQDERRPGAGCGPDPARAGRLLADRRHRRPCQEFQPFPAPGGRFLMTPLYDVMSAEPSVAAGQITRRQAKLAMALGEKRHYRLDEIMPRHLEQTAALADVDPGLVRAIGRDILASAEERASSIADELRESVPDAVRRPILEALRGRLRLLAAGLGS